MFCLICFNLQDYVNGMDFRPRLTETTFLRLSVLHVLSNVCFVFGFVWFKTDISEKDQRKGSKILQPEEDSAVIDLHELKQKVMEEDSAKPKVIHSSQKHTYGSGSAGLLNK